MKGLVRIPVADLRREPTFQSERTSQALFNTPVELGEEKENYISTALPDGYTGWMQKSHLFFPAPKSFTGQRMKVGVPFLPVFTANHMNKISVLTFNTSARIFKQSGSWAAIGSDEKML
ncbi:MAG TPA: hypothetical protein VI546_05510, partial [candidate division Zixibacteria bacterium]|nr:hypothetical protein [candidate division Zixibacteria bacterium]